jgi:hypothetical protein
MLQISGLIEELQALKAEFGDLPMEMYNTEQGLGINVFATGGIAYVEGCERQ